MSSPLSGRLALLVVKRVYLCSHSCLQTFSPLYFSLNPFVCKIWHFHIFIAEQIPDFGSIVQKIRCSYWQDRKTLVELALPILYTIHIFVFRLVFPSGQIRLEAQLFSHTPRVIIWSSFDFVECMRLLLWWFQNYGGIFFAFIRIMK